MTYNYGIPVTVVDLRGVLISIYAIPQIMKIRLTWAGTKAQADRKEVAMDQFISSNWHGLAGAGS